MASRSTRSRVLFPLSLSLAVHLLVITLTFVAGPNRTDAPRPTSDAMDIEFIAPGAVAEMPPEQQADEGVAAEESAEVATPKVARPAAKPRARARRPPPPKKGTRDHVAGPGPMSLAMRTKAVPMLRDLPSPELPNPSKAQPPRRRESVRLRKRELETRINDWVYDEQDRHRFRAGLVHGNLFEILRRAEGFFAPTWTLTEGDVDKIGTVGNTMKSFIQEVGRAYQQQLKDQTRARARAKVDRLPNLLESYGSVIKAVERSAAALSCDLCVRLERGKAPVMTLTRSSGRRPFDAMAKAALKKGLRQRELDVDFTPVLACYQFKASFWRFPPVPVVGCNFDEVELTASCFYPFKKLLRAGAKLISVKTLRSGSS